MPELTREEKIKIFEKLPQRLQDFLYSEDTGAFLLYLGQKYNLPDEKISALSKIVGDIILKITPITSLAQEIVNKVILDSQIAMAIAQELNSELLIPVLTPTPVVSMTPAMPAAPQIQSPAPSRPAPAPLPAPAPTTPTPAAPTPKTDQYREPTTVPEIIDLRNQPTAGPPLAEMPTPLPINLKDFATAPAPVPAPLPKPIPRPLTFTKPIEPAKSIPLIEAEPHRIAPLPPVLEEKPMANLPPVVSPSTPLSAGKIEPRPQYIIRPPGMAPTDLPRDVLDLRKDKGEF